VLPVLVVAAVVAGVVLVFPLLAAGSGGLSPSESGVTTSADGSSPSTGVVRMGVDGDPVAPETTPGAPETTPGQPPAEAPGATTPEGTPEGPPTVPGSASPAESASAGSASAGSSSAGSSSAGSSAVDSPATSPATSSSAGSPSASSPAASSPAGAPAGSPSAGSSPAGSPPAAAPPVASASAGSSSAGTTTRAPEPAPAAAAMTAATPAASGSEAAVLDLVNQARAQAGCGAVTADPALAAVARAHSADMRDRGYFSHTTPEGLSPFDRAGAAGISYARAENIAYGQRDAAAVMDAWMNSAGHRANILNCSLSKLGVGVAEGPGGPWWTQLLG
jgi:uncharacterized protein YkwD